MWKGLVLAGMAALAALSWGANSEQEWLFQGPPTDFHGASKVDSAGNAFVLGYTKSGNIQDGIFLTKITPSGQQAWRYSYTIANRYFAPGAGLDLAPDGTIYISFNNFLMNASQVFWNGYQTVVAVNPTGTQKWIKHYQRAGAALDKLRIAGPVAALGNTGCAFFCYEPDTLGNWFPVLLRFSATGTIASEVAHPSLLPLQAGYVLPVARFVNGVWLLGYGPGGNSPQMSVVGFNAVDQVTFTVPFRTDGPCVVDDFSAAGDGTFLAVGAAKYGQGAQFGVVTRLTLDGELLSSTPMPSGNRTSKVEARSDGSFEVMGRGATSAQVFQVTSFRETYTLVNKSSFLPYLLTVSGMDSLFLCRPSGSPYDAATTGFLAPRSYLSGFTQEGTVGSLADPESARSAGFGPNWHYSVIAVNPSTNVYRVRGYRIGPYCKQEGLYALRNTPVSGNVLTNDSYYSGLTPVVAQMPAHGSVQLQANGNFTYTPTTGWTGTDSFTYSLTRGTLTSTATVTVITQLPSRPVQIQGPSTLYVGQTGNYRVHLNSAPTSPSGQVVNLSSIPAGYLTAPATVTVPQGSTYANFSVTCNTYDSGWISPYLRATVGTSIISNAITTSPNRLDSLSLAPTSISDTGSSLGTVTTATTASTTVALKADVDWLTIPASLTVSGGVGTFMITPNVTLGHSVTTTIRATSYSVTKTATLTVNP